MASTNDQITQKFPYPVLTTLGNSNTDPSFATLQIVQQELYANAASVHTLRGDGISGHLILTITAEAYTVRSVLNVAFTVPPCPPAQGTHTAPATGHTISEENRLHLEARRELMLYTNIENALRNQLQAAVPKVYISAILDPIIGIGNTTCLTLLTHLHDTYRTITEAELKINLGRMKIQSNPPTSIENHFTQIKDGVAFATAGGDPPTGPSIIRIAYNIVAAAGQFDITTHEWRAKTVTQKIGPPTKSISRQQTRTIVCSKRQAQQDTTGHPTWP
jgi:hypothetical protein